ncbi:MAG: WD40 repeat domain-containing protein [Pirellulales bacterium]|nr:WD40 repeat domain-containing protein [Pirellulales bacterium]
MLWNTDSWTINQKFDHGESDLNAAEFSADGTLLAIAGDDGKVTIYRLADGSLIFSERVVNGRAFQLEWLGASHEVAVGGEEPVVRVIDVDQLRLRGAVDLAKQLSYEGPPQLVEEINVVEYVPATDSIVVVTNYGHEHIVDAKTLRVLRSWIDVGHGAMCHVPVGPGYLVTGNVRSVSLWNLETAHRDLAISTQDHPRAIRYSPTTKSVAVFLRDGTAATWKCDSLLAGGLPARRFVTGSDRTQCGDMSPDGQCLVMGDNEGRLHIWQGIAVDGLFDVELSRRSWTALFSPDGRWMAVLEVPSDYAPSTLIVFDVETRCASWSTEAQSPQPTYVGSKITRAPWPVDFNADSTEIYFTQPDNSVCGRVLRTGELSKCYLSAKGGNQDVNRIHRLPDSARLYVCQTNDKRFLIDCSTGRVEGLPFEPNFSTFGMIHTVHGDLWLTNEQKSCVKFLWATDMDHPIATLRGCPDKDQLRVAVSRDGRELAIGGEGRIIYCWDLIAGGAPRKFIGHEGMISEICFSADGRTILSHASDGTVRFWHVATGAELLKLGTADEPITCMGLNPAGNLLVLGVERDGRYGLQLHRLGPNRDSLPKTFSGLPTRQVANP